MIFYRIFAWTLALTLLAGCAGRVPSILQEPELANVGDGLSDDLTTGTVESHFADEAATQWQGGPTDFFRDSRPGRRGDALTVNITVNDSATFSNSSNRSRKSNATTSTEFGFGLFPFLSKGNGEATAQGDASASGQGSIVRSEKLRVQLTAIVRQVLPNGYLVIEGSQQVLVNHEMRDLRVAGIVNPRDIASDNSIDYHRIAEGRAYYGGAGQVSSAQKPKWGSQLWDKITPF